VSGLHEVPLVSVIVPVLDEAATIEALLDHLASLPGRWEVLIADGGSRDGTPELARSHPLAPQVGRAPRGRARQLNSGAQAARGDVLLFLHADSRLPMGAHGAIAAALRAPACPGGNFALRFEGAGVFTRYLAAYYAVQRSFGVYYGDSTIWVRAGTWRELGGFRDLPIMEDYEFVRRLERRGRTARLPGPATTSGRRWERAGVARTVASWVLIRYLWMLGVPADRLARLYSDIR